MQQNNNKSKKNSTGENAISGQIANPHKRIRVSINISNDFVLTDTFVNDKLIEDLSVHWQNNSEIYAENIEFYQKPFKLCIFKNLLKNCNVTKKISEEIITLDWSKKQMDLYEFHQSKDLSTFETGYLKSFFECLQNNLKPLIEKICKLNITHISASCSMYNSGDYLLVHDDLLNDRQIAFVFYISPWTKAKKWLPKMGGCLEIFNANSENYPQFPLERQINPEDNQFVFFKVGKKSFHQVGEITSFNYPRLTINGWFHGEPNKDFSKSYGESHILHLFKEPHLNEKLFIKDWINSDYLKLKTMAAIQTHFENNSEISLNNFLKPSEYNNICNALQNNNLKWISKQPANSFNYEILEYNNVHGILKCFLNLMSSTKFFKLLYKLTCLDLYGPNSKSPKVYIEMQKWVSGSYTILGNTNYNQKNGLDLILFFNANDSVGVTTYLASQSNLLEQDNSEQTLLTIYPNCNMLNLVYTTGDNIKFTKYVSKNIYINNGQTFILHCTYKE